MSDSFKIEEPNNKKKKNKTIAISKMKLLVFSVSFVVICSILGFVMYYYMYYVNYIPKTNKNKPYVYTIDEYENSTQDGTYDRIPTINLKGNKFKKINQAIKKNYDEVSKTLEYDYSYDFNKSKNILAVKITYSYFLNEGDQYPTRQFETFNIDLRNGKILSNSDILKKYNLTEKRVNSFIESKFKAFYKDLVAGKFYTKKECNYDCFLEQRGLTNNYLSNASYYIEDGSLTLFMYYNIYSDYLEEQYLKYVGYQFLIKE